MTIVFTICSNNYLAQAKVLMQSVLKHVPDLRFYIGLVDERSADIDYATFSPAQIITIKELGLPDFEFLINEYFIIELNTCIKPSLFKYIKNKNPDCRHLIYLDPDIKVYHDLSIVTQQIESSSMVLTPHFTAPIPLDGKNPGENLALNYGVYNLGFLGINPAHRDIDPFLDWWEERCLKLGYSRVEEGLFVDQLWINLVPIYYRDVTVMNHPGLNTAPWNFHERSISLEAGQYKVNQDFPLVFHHFSSFSIVSGTTFSKWYNRYGFEDLPVVRDLYMDYRQEVLSNDYVRLKQIQYVYGKKVIKQFHKRVINKIKSMFLN